MSVPDDERRQLAKKYRDLAASELLSLFEKREELAAATVDALRSELRLRGLDPDSLRATVPRALSGDDDGSAGDATLAEAELPEEPSKSVRKRSAPEPEGESADSAESEPAPEGASAAEEVAAAAAIRCAQCGARNPAIEDLCLRCGQPLGDLPQHQTMARRITESHTAAARPSGTIASATTGVVGISSLVFALYSVTLENRVLAVSLLASLVGTGALIAATLLYRAEKKRRDAEAAAG